MPAGPALRSAALAAAMLTLALPGCKPVYREAELAAQKVLAERAAQKALAERAARQATKAQAAPASHTLREAGERAAHVGGHHAVTHGADKLKEKLREHESDEKWRNRQLTAGPERSAAQSRP